VYLCTIKITDGLLETLQFAHVDHGKTTLVDKIMYHCQLFRDNKKTQVTFDNNDLERERGITITSKCFCTI
jgi:predicted membrane GTPase involved in stress response